jgi:ubiquinone/menaquinone biosynthesis C-methylase UbiE
VGFYLNRIVPYLVNWAMRNNELQPYRERVVSAAEGRVLEIGIGSGMNIPLYSRQVGEVLGLEPSERLVRMSKKEVAARAADRPGLNVRLIEGSAEAIPLDRHSVDTVVTTWTLCTIPDALAALHEIHRVLKPSGQLLFVEHGLAPEDKIRRWQNRLTPIWQRFAGGCHLNRPIRELIEKTGFEITQIDTGYIEGPKLMTFFYEGRATPR